MHSPDLKAYAAPAIFDGDQWHRQHALVIRGDRIEGVVPLAQLPPDMALTRIEDRSLAPGLIDVQVNGGGGLMLNNAPSPESVATIVAAHRQYGTTGLAPTVISDTAATMQDAAEAVATARAGGESGVLALHIEGPHFAMEKRGTHHPKMIRPISEQDLAWLESLNHLPVMLTVAPEHMPAGYIRQLADAGILVCAGHTNADYAQIQQAREEGLRGFTHLFNAMSQQSARAPGTVGAALDADDTWAGIIADGHHVHPATIRSAQRAKAPGTLMLVSDAMATVGGRDSFEIYGQTIAVQDGALRNAEGKLAGSAISLIDAVRYCHKVVGLPLAECLRMASHYPAAFLKLEHELGRLQSGYRADFFAFDADFTVSETWVAGQHRNHTS